MFCNYCGASNPDDASFCSTCGKALVRPLSKASPPQRTSPNVPSPAPQVPPARAQPAAAVAEVPKPARPGVVGERVRTLTGHSFPIYALAFSPDGRHVVSGSLDHTAKLWDAVEGRILRTFSGRMTFASVDFSPDGRLLALASTNGSPLDNAKPETNSISLWAPARPDEMRSLTGHEGQVFCVRFSPDGDLLASSNGGSLVRLWDTTSGRIIKSFKYSWLRSKVFGGGCGSSLAFSPDGQLLAARSWPVTLWDLARGKEVRTFGPESLSTFMAVFVGFAPDGQSVVEAKGNRMIRIWDVTSGKELRRLADPPKRNGVVDRLICAALSKDGNHLAVSTYSSADENTDKVTVWNLRSARPVATVDISDSCHALAFSPDGQWLAVAGALYDGGKVVGQIKLQRISEIT
jgi:WD40 repeat protein